jgi:hypothetical protein
MRLFTIELPVTGWRSQLKNCGRDVGSQFPPNVVLSVQAHRPEGRLREKLSLLPKHCYGLAVLKSGSKSSSILPPILNSNHRQPAIGTREPSIWSIAILEDRGKKGDVSRSK